MHITAAFPLIRPYAWLALFAFVVGFTGCLALTWPRSAADTEANASMISAPASHDWNTPKRI